MRITSLIILLMAFVVTAQAAPQMHPDFQLRDKDGIPLLGPTRQASGVVTCGECHDTEYIQSHNSHWDKGLTIDCFVCHFAGGLLSLSSEDFSDSGKLQNVVKTPDSMVCGSCHGIVHNSEKPLEITEVYSQGLKSGHLSSSMRTGSVFSGQRMSESFLNLKQKSSLGQSWDVHAAGLLECSSCHFAPNKPGKKLFSNLESPAHLRVDPRVANIGQYLEKPDHRLATAGCISCHDTDAAHPNLPYVERHISVLECQACHIPKLMAPAVQVVDRTVATIDGSAHIQFRGLAKPAQGSPNTWFSQGYSPFLLLKDNKYAAYNLGVIWHWAESGVAAGAVAQDKVTAAWLNEDGGYHAELIPIFDADGNGKIDSSELILDSNSKHNAILQRLKLQGLDDVHIVGNVQAYPVNHGVVASHYLDVDCNSCHSSGSRLGQDILLVAGSLPGGVVPDVGADVAALLSNRHLELFDQGLRIVSEGTGQNSYVPGYTRKSWSEIPGMAFLLLTVMAVFAHGATRFVLQRRRGTGQQQPAAAGQAKKQTYMYSQHIRVGHWIMGMCVVLLLASGMQIHFPRQIHLLDYRTTVLLHNIVAGVFIFNTFLYAFFHLTSNEISQFIPQQTGLLKKIQLQARYYLLGIFRDEEHPAHKTVVRRLNPLQQITYLGLFVVLIPLQIVTGILMWVAGVAPEITAGIGGLSVIAPIHSLGSWLFLAFLLMHVYLTTTGHTTLTNLKAMVGGWEDVESGSDTEVK